MIIEYSTNILLTYDYLFRCSHQFHEFQALEFIEVFWYCTSIIQRSLYQMNFFLPFTKFKLTVLVGTIFNCDSK